MLQLLKIARNDGACVNNTQTGVDGMQRTETIAVRPSESVGPTQARAAGKRPSAQADATVPDTTAISAQITQLSARRQHGYRRGMMIPGAATTETCRQGAGRNLLPNPSQQISMNRDDRDDPFGDIFDEIERMMGEMDDTGDADADAHIDVYDDDNVVRLVADLPGVEKSDLNLQCDGTTLTITAHSGHHEYDQQVRLPAPVDEHSADATFNNGVLHVTFDREDDSAAIDVE